MTEYCAAHSRMELLAQWDPEENGGLSPDSLTYGSHQKVWWRCEQGHRWQAAVYARTGSGTGCPYCGGQRLIPGEGDLAAGFPNLAAQWHPTRNGSLRPEQLHPGSHRLVWWQCEKGHTWRASVHSRTGGSGCPVCAGKVVASGENDLESRFPELAAQWHPTRNGSLSPRQVGVGSCKKVWWQCEKGHQWQAAVYARVHGNGCPVCAGKKVLPGENDLATAFPAIAAQWHPTRNGALTPSQLAPTSNRKVWWRCEKGHSYPATVSGRTTRQAGCPYCTGRKVLPGFNDLETLEPKIAAQWHPTLNGTLTPDQVTTGCHRKVWWQCSCGYVWKAVVYSRAGSSKCGCPACAGKVKRSHKSSSMFSAR